MIVTGAPNCYTLHMNILFVTENLFPDVMGGSGRVVTETGKRLVMQGHTVHVVSRQVAGTESEDSLYGMSVHRYACNGHLFATWHHLQATLQTVAAKGSIDIIIVCQPFQGLAVLRCNALSGIPVVRDFYGPWHDEYRVKKCGYENEHPIPISVKAGMLLRKMADLHVLKHVNRIRVLSEYTADIIKEICPGHVPISTIPAGIDLVRFSCGTREDARESLHIDIDRPVIFTVRNLTPRMGLDILIAATAKIKTQIPNILTIIGGTGFLRPELEKQAEQLGLTNHIQFAGRMFLCCLHKP